MSFWNYIGEFFFFRWLFGSRKCDVTGYNDSETSVRSFSDNIDDISNISDWDISRSSHSYDDFLDEHDDYDMMDDVF